MVKETKTNKKRDENLSQQRQQEQQNKFIVVDASNCVSGRICSKVSKLLLQGNRVSVVNAEKVMISGNKYEII